MPDPGADDWSQPWLQPADQGFDPGAMHPAVAQSLGLPVPNATPPLPPPTPDPNASPASSPPNAPPPLPGEAGPPMMPSFIQPPADGQPIQGQPDFVVPPGTPGTPTAAPGTPTGANPIGANPAKPLTHEQQLAQVQAKRDEATGQEQQAIGQETQANTAKDAADRAAIKKYIVQSDANDAQLRANQDQNDKINAVNTGKVAQAQSDLDNFKIDRNQYWNSLGVGSKIGMYVAMAMTGIGDALQHNNGPNAVISMLQDRVKDSITDQVDRREQLKEKLGRARQSVVDQNNSFESRNAEILRQQGLFNGQLARQFQLSAAQSADPLHRANALKQSALVEKQSASELNQGIQEENAYQNQKAQLRIAQGHLAIAGAAEGREQMIAKAEYGNPNAVPGQGPQGLKWQEADLKAADIAERHADAQAKNALHAQGKITDEERKLAVTAPVEGNNGKAVPLFNSDGRPYLAPNEKSGEKSRDMISAATTYTRLAGDMIRTAQDHTGESSWFKSDAWKKQISKLEEMTGEMGKVYGLERFSEPAIEHFKKMATAGVNPTSFIYDVTGALKSSSQDLERKLNDHLTSQNYDGKPISMIHAWDLPAPKETEQDRLNKIVSGSQPDPGAVYNPDLKRWEPKVPGMYDPIASSKLILSGDQGWAIPYMERKQDSITKQFPSMGQGQRAILDMIASRLNSGDPQTIQKTRTQLEGWAKSSGNDGVSDYAKYLLNRPRDINAKPQGPGQSLAPPKPISAEWSPEVAKALGIPFAR